jgi:HD-GYP domain-containing protein (c-di-GMP phosphodiesterase class II)
MNHLFHWMMGLRKHDVPTYSHSLRVAMEFVGFIRHARFDVGALRDIYFGGLLHDIGKMDIPGNVLRRRGELTRGEWARMEKHPETAFVWLYPFFGDANVTLEIGLMHHERWDGSGYPFGLSGCRIPRVARLFAIVDVFDAMTADDRSYRDGAPKALALSYLAKNAGVLFDPDGVEAYIRFRRSLSAKSACRAPVLSGTFPGGFLEGEARKTPA